MYPLDVLVREALGQLTAQGVAYRLEGLVWHQGENDMFVPEYMARYGDHLIGFMDRLRRFESASTSRIHRGTVYQNDMGNGLETTHVCHQPGAEKAAGDKHALYVRNAHGC